LRASSLDAFLRPLESSHHLDNATYLSERYKTEGGLGWREEVKKEERK